MAEPLASIRAQTAQRHMEVLGIADKIYSSGRLDSQTFRTLNADGNRYLDQDEVAAGLQEASRRELKKLNKGLDALERVNELLPRYLNSTRAAALSPTVGGRLFHLSVRHGASSQLRYAREDRARAEKKINDVWRDIAGRYASR